MGRQNKLIRFLTAMTVTAAIISGCSGISKTISTQIPTFNVEKPEPVKINFCFQGYTNDGKPWNLSHINEMLEELNKKTIKEINTEISFQWLPYENYDTELKKLLKTENAPDAYFTWNLRSYYEDGLAKDITDLFPAYAPNYYSQIEETRREDNESGKIDNKLYTVLNNQLFLPQYFVVARKDLVDKYSPQGISNFEEYDSFMQAVKINEKDKVPGLVNPYDVFKASLIGNGYLSIYYSDMYSSMNSSEMNPVLIEDTQAFKDAYKMYKSWKENDIVINYNNPDSSMKSMTGQLASVLIFGYQLHNNFSFPSNIKYCTYTLYPDSTYQRSGNMDTLVINSNSEKADRVILFFEWLQSCQENYDLFMYGIKDKNYKQVGNSIDFSNFDNNYVIADWWGSEAFRNYIYDRPYMHEPEDYREFVKDASITNTKTMVDIYKSFGYDVDENSEPDASKKAQYEKLNTQMQEFEAARDKVYNEFINQIQEGNFKKTLNEMMDEAGCTKNNDKLLESYRSYMKLFKK